jgi:cytochrome o ubiquinol oxidase subunit 2
VLTLVAKQRLNKNYKRAFVAVIIAWFIGLMFWYLHGKNFAVLSPAGAVAVKERNLLVLTVVLGILVIIPVFVMTFWFAWKYREGNPNPAKYSPEIAGNRLAETIWWGVPTAIILVLSVVTWNSSHALDPHKPLSGGRAMNIQVVALDWKWLFIYPEQNVASINYLELPVGQPVTFSITADAPMNSFWIPQLGGQIYAMPGMATRLNLVADRAGSYEGSSANLSGQGFSSMRFTAQAEDEAGFNRWLQLARSSPDTLNMPLYRQLVKPSENNHVTQYSGVESDLFQKVILKYMVPEKS